MFKPVEKKKSTKNAFEGDIFAVARLTREDMDELTNKPIRSKKKPVATFRDSDDEFQDQ